MSERHPDLGPAYLDEGIFDLHPLSPKRLQVATPPPDTADFDNVTRAAISAEMRRQRERIQELLTRNTELVEENRRLRQRTTRQQDVTAFLVACDPTTPLPPKPEVPSEFRVRSDLRIISEEYLELLDACLCVDLTRLREWIAEAINLAPVDVDMPEMVDATIDAEYTLHNLRIHAGVDDEPMWRAVQAANMSKLGGPVVDGKIRKPAGWRAPPIQELLMAQGWDGK